MGPATGKVLRMKTYQYNRTKPYTSNNTNKTGHGNGCFENLDQIAEELEKLARRRLPDRVLQGVLAGYEEDIRQDAILMALGWYLRKDISAATNPGRVWHGPRAIAGALRIIKRDCVKALKGEAEARRAMLPQVTTTTCHPVMIRGCDWPTSTMRRLTKMAIRIAHRTGRITSLNAAIAIEVFVNGIQVIEMAKRFNVHRSNIYQHLSRVRRHIPEIINELEVSLHDV